MVKILILIVAILGVGLIAYNQGTKNPPSQNSEQADTVKGNADVLTSHETTNTGIPDKEPIVSNGNLLDLSGKGLTQTPKYVFGETGTQKLDLSGNKLMGSLQAEIRHLQNLKVLDLSNNQFTGVPAEIGQLKNLEVLDLSNNSITGLPLELGNLSNLKVLNLKGNDYSEMDLSLIKERLPASVVIEVD